jgi:hypothetical protein
MARRMDVLMEFISGFTGIASVVVLALLIGSFRVFLVSQNWMAAKMKRRQSQDVALLVYRAGELYSIKYITIKAAAQGALESEVSPYCIVANGEMVWQAWEVDNIERTLEKLAM